MDLVEIWLKNFVSLLFHVSMFVIQRHHMQSHEFRFLTSMHKQRLLEEIWYFERCNQQTDLKHDTKHACVFIVMYFVYDLTIN